MDYDDHSYCGAEECGLELPDCWCFAYRSAATQVARAERSRMDICPGGPGHGLVGEDTPPTWPRELHLFRAGTHADPVEVELAGGGRALVIPQGAEFSLPPDAAPGSYYLATTDVTDCSADVFLGPGCIVSTPAPAGGVAEGVAV